MLRDFGAWDLEIPWGLEFDIWSFSAPSVLFVVSDRRLLQAADSRAVRKFPPSALKEENSAFVETTTRLRFPLEFVVDIPHICV